MSKAAAAVDDDEDDEGGRKKRKKDGKPDDGRPELGAPLFPDRSDDWTHVTVERVEPTEEPGYMGDLPIDATEADIRRRWGGGKYKVRARNGHNQVKGNSTITVAGPPVFLDQVNKARYERGLGNFGAQGPAGGALGMGEMLTVLSAIQAQSQQQQLALIQAQAQQRNEQLAEERRIAEERRRDDKEREERRLKDEREREERRLKDEREREERREKEREESRRRDRDHMQSLLQVATSNTKGGDATAVMQALVQGIGLGARIRGEGGGDDDEEGDGEEDPIGAAVKSALEGVTEYFKGRKGEGAGDKPGEASSSAPANDNELRLTGEIGAKALALVEDIKARGGDPEKLLANVFDGTRAKIARAPIKTKPPAPAPKDDGAEAPANGHTGITDEQRRAAAKLVKDAAAAVKA